MGAALELTESKPTQLTYRLVVHRGGGRSVMNILAHILRRVQSVSDGVEGGGGGGGVEDFTISPVGLEHAMVALLQAEGGRESEEKGKREEEGERGERGKREEEGGEGRRGEEREREGGREGERERKWSIEAGGA